MMDRKIITYEEWANHDMINFYNLPDAPKHTDEDVEDLLAGHKKMMERRDYTIERLEARIKELNDDKNALNDLIIDQDKRIKELEYIEYCYNNIYNDWKESRDTWVRRLKELEANQRPDGCVGDELCNMVRETVKRVQKLREAEAKGCSDCCNWKGCSRKHLPCDYYVLVEPCSGGHQ